MTGPRYGAILTKRQAYEVLRAQLDVERVSFISHWKDLNDYIRPRRGRFQITDVNRGERRSQKIIDSTATFAARTCSSGMHAGLTNPARPWFTLAPPDPRLAEQGAVKEWLETVRRDMESVFLRSNVYWALPIVYDDAGVFGTAAMAVLEDDESVIRCHPFPIGSYWLGVDAKGRVRVFMREFRMTVRQLLERFGQRNAAGEITNWHNFSPDVQARYRNSQFETWQDVIHVIAPNEEHNPRRLEAQHLPFSSCYYEKGASGQTGAGDDRFLEESGFEEFPIMAPRWSVTGEDTYGTESPGIMALGDIRQLQTMEKRGGQALDKLVNPPMVAQPEMRTAKLSSLPGDVSYVRDPNAKGFRPAYQILVPFQELNGEKDTVRGRIRQAFYADLFLMLANIDRADITATEVAERKEEKMLALGPLLEQFNQDLYGPLIDRTFAIMQRRGLIPPPPPELHGVTLRVEYRSVMAQAQKAGALSSIERFTNFLGGVAKIDPSAMDKVDRDELVAQHADAGGIPPQIIRGDDQVQAARQTRAQQLQQQQRMAMIESGSKSAKFLAQADTGGKNALSDLLSAVGGAGGDQAGGAAPGAAA